MIVPLELGGAGDDRQHLVVLFFAEVQNIEELRQSVIDGTVEASFINPEPVYCRAVIHCTCLLDYILR